MMSAGGRRAALSIVLASVAGVGIAGYLSWHRLSGAPLLCGGTGDCDLVNASRFAYLLGVPVAYWGLAMYLTLLALAAWILLAPAGAPASLPLVILGLAAGGAAFSLYLTAMEVFVLRAICRWCVASQAAILLILIFAIRLAAATGASGQRSDRLQALSLADRIKRLEGEGWIEPLDKRVRNLPPPLPLEDERAQKLLQEDRDS